MRTASRLLATALLSGAVAAAAQDDPAALAEAARCGMCHHPEQAMLGPSWQAIAERYAGDENAAALLAHFPLERAMLTIDPTQAEPAPQPRANARQRAGRA